mgnify:CR=1 FL=1
MKRTKRKYTRRTTPVESKSSGIETGGNTITPPEVIEPTVKAFSFEDLPLSIRMRVENTLKVRKRLKLPDDSVERKVQAIEMFRGVKVR